MAFVNTRDVIGDQATVDGLVEHSLTELKEDGISNIASMACYCNAGLQSIELPNASTIQGSAFKGCTNLETVKLGGEGSTGSLSIASYAFENCSKLKHLVIDRPEMATLASTSVLNSTQIALGEGAVYVPEILLSTYKADNVWKNYFITRLDKYPLSSFDTIEDSWPDIFANANYATDYAVKDTKTLELTDGTKIKMDLAALDTDVKSDDSGTAKMTWICHGIPFTHRMNASGTTSGGYDESEMASYLVSDILSKFPTEVRSHVVSVKKYHRSKSSTDEILTSNLEIFLLSHHEVFGTITQEDSGPVYSTLFPYNMSRIKYDTSGLSTDWWLRSARDTTNFRCVNSSGGEYYYYASSTRGVVFGFCTD